MDEESLRTDYWVDNRSDKEFPLWVIFRMIGQETGIVDGMPYVRPSRESLPALLKRLEEAPETDRLCEALGLARQEVSAAFWYLIWLVERMGAPPNPHWTEWNRRVDEAWDVGILK